MGAIRRTIDLIIALVNADFDQRLTTGRRFMSPASQGADLSQVGRTVALLRSHASFGDLVALMKPRVMSLVVFTALVGLLVAPGHLDPLIGFVALLCITAGAGAAGVLNMWYDADIDSVAAVSRNPTDHRRKSAGGAADDDVLRRSAL